MLDLESKMSSYCSIYVDKPYFERIRMSIYLYLFDYILKGWCQGQFVPNPVGPITHLTALIFQGKNLLAGLTVYLKKRQV